MTDKQKLSDLADIIKPEEIERAMIEKELQSQKIENDPLDTHAQLFFLYNPRFQGQLNFMSKKQCINLMLNLAGSPFNDPSETKKLAAVSNGMNLKGLQRVIAATIEHPLSKETMKLLSAKEQKLFQVFDSLLTNKYYESIKVGLEVKEKDNEAIKDLEDVIKHDIDTTSKAFTSRDEVEKDGFSTANKLLASKFLMMMSSAMDFYRENPNVVENVQDNE